jgi:hypothetical protein
MFICLRLRTPYPAPPLLIVYVYTVYLFTQEKGWGVEPERRGGGATVHKAGVENTNMTVLYLQSINSDKHLPQTLFTGQFLR